jgi:hypothetical protein
VQGARPYSVWKIALLTAGIAAVVVAAAYMLLG